MCSMDTFLKYVTLDSKTSLKGSFFKTAAADIWFVRIDYDITIYSSGSPQHYILLKKIKL